MMWLITLSKSSRSQFHNLTMNGKTHDWMMCQMIFLDPPTHLTFPTRLFHPKATCWRSTIENVMTKWQFPFRWHYINCKTFQANNYIDIVQQIPGNVIIRYWISSNEGFSITHFKCLRINFRGICLGETAKQFRIDNNLIIDVETQIASASNELFAFRYVIERSFSVGVRNNMIFCGWLSWCIN